MWMIGAFEREVMASLSDPGSSVSAYGLTAGDKLPMGVGGERRGEEEGQRAVLSELIHFQMGPWVAVEPRDRGFFLGVF